MVVSDRLEPAGCEKTASQHLSISHFPISLPSISYLRNLTASQGVGVRQTTQQLEHDRQLTNRNVTDNFPMVSVTDN